MRAPITGSDGELANIFVEDLLAEVVTEEDMAQTVLTLVCVAIGAPLTNNQVVDRDWTGVCEAIHDQLIAVTATHFPEDAAVRVALEAVEQWIAASTDFPKINENIALTKEQVQRALDNEDELAAFAASSPARPLEETREQLQRMLEQGKFGQEVDADRAAAAWRYREVWETARARHLPNELPTEWAAIRLRKRMEQRYPRG